MIKRGAISGDIAAASATGLEPQFAAAMAYLAGPLSGIIILMAERSNRFVRFHAWQAILGLGGLAVLALLFLFLAFAGLFVWPSAFAPFSWLAAICGVVWLLTWGVCLVKAFGGTAFRLPIVGERAARRALRAQP